MYSKSGDQNQKKTSLYLVFWSYSIAFLYYLFGPSSKQWLPILAKYQFSGVSILVILKTRDEDIA